MPQAGESGWCHLRRLAIHPELSSELWCHHWTARSPRLPLSPGPEPGMPAEAHGGGGGGAPRLPLQSRPGGDGGPRGGSRQLTLEALLPQF
ncbi:conserved hypothetical protein [Cyanobium sp. PCC 7001]|uniref:hypothetical protein n=1 Tax=Cyanobium sp. PCC 7001 TaxID=180281 RepID=UPI0001805975|nr:hypothetical protein [Cyanobium sp. PCC 7001]EDY38781.1 conserved hypothetical protein [Cyanobium sp. PCC 7001]